MSMLMAGRKVSQKTGPRTLEGQRQVLRRFKGIGGSISEHGQLVICERQTKDKGHLKMLGMVGLCSLRS